MVLDAAAVAAGVKDAQVKTCRHLCRSELSLFRDIAEDAAPLTVTCTQEAPLFEEIAEDEALPAALTFVNVRETAGWSNEGAQAGAKMAALIAAAAVAEPPPPAVALESEGVTLIYGRGQAALDAAERLKDRLDITVLLADAAGAMPLRRAGLSRAQGQDPQRSRATSAASRSPSTAMPSRPHRPAPPMRSDQPATGSSPNATSFSIFRAAPRSSPARTCARAISGCDPANAADVERALSRAADLAGTFDKPRYITFRADLCAHCALAHHRLHAVPRSVPGRRHHIRWQCRRHRSADLRRLRPMRGGLSDGRGLL